MPLTKRAVSPVLVSRNTLPEGVYKDELQCVANGTLANLVRQLSSLSKHAEHIFGEIFHEAVKLDHKTNTLRQRLDRLTEKVSKFDADNEQGSLDDAHMRKHFKSSCLVDQHTLDRATLPNALTEGYTRCDQPPNLDALNPYRESAVPALSLYTNPSFFFDLWRQEMLKDCNEGRRRMKSPGGSPKKKRQRPPGQPPGVPGQQQMGGGDTQRQHSNRYMTHLRGPPVGVLSFPEEYQAPQALGLQLGSQGHRGIMMDHQPLPPPPSSLLPPHPGMSVPHSMRPLTSTVRSSQSPSRDLPPPDLSLLSIDDEDDDLPPPPPPLMHTSIVQQMPTTQQNPIQLLPTQESQLPACVPPPPPPPPPPMAPPPPIATSFGGGKRENTENKEETKQKERVPDTMSNLLAEIQNGYKLKKVRRAEEEAEEKAATAGNDVAAILQRRMEQILGRDDDSQSSGGGGDSDEWDE